jgi:hypothetical protein
LTLNPRLMELEIEMAKQIPVEVFHAPSSEVEDTIQNRHKGKNWRSELIPEGMARELSDLAGFRNVLVHVYWG